MQSSLLLDSPGGPQAEKTFEQHVQQQATAAAQDDCWAPRRDMPMAGVRSASFGGGAAGLRYVGSMML